MKSLKKWLVLKRKELVKLPILIDDEGHNPRMNAADLKDHGSVIAIFRDEIKY